MIKLLAVLVLTLSAATVRADAFSDLVRMAGPSAGDIAKIQMPGGSPVGQPVVVSGSSQQTLIRVTSAQWDASFPIKREAIAAAGRAQWTKPADKWACEFVPGSSTVRCDFAYDVWPEMCWYGYDHVVADLDLNDPKATKVVSKEWRRD